MCSVEGRGGKSAGVRQVRKGETGAMRQAHLGWCSVGSWEPHRSGHGSRSHRRTPTGGSSDSARWHSGTHWGHRLGTLGEGGAVRLGVQCPGTAEGTASFHLGPRSSPHSGDSSDPSAQSRSWSHTKCLGMHWWFWHMNSRSSQVLLYTMDREAEAPQPCPCQPLSHQPPTPLPWPPCGPRALEGSLDN